MADRVIPNSLNYADIKPEAVETEIKLVKFTPTSSVSGAKGGDIVKFLLVGNGFMDPYSTYLSFTVDVSQTIGDNEIRFLDRSAHSFISRVVIRSQGVEIERIENYDVIAAMIHDMIYSPEQNALHHWEGFPNQQLIPDAFMSHNEIAGNSVFQQTVIPEDESISRYANHFVSFQTDVVNGGSSILPCDRARTAVAQLIGNSASPILNSYVGEMCFSNGIHGKSKNATRQIMTSGQVVKAQQVNRAQDYIFANADAVTGYTFLNGGQGDDVIPSRFYTLMAGESASTGVPLNTRNTWEAAVLGSNNAAVALRSENEFADIVRLITRFSSEHPRDVDVFRDARFMSDAVEFGQNGIDQLIAGVITNEASAAVDIYKDAYLNPVLNLSAHSALVPLQYNFHERGKRVSSICYDPSIIKKTKTGEDARADVLQSEFCVRSTTQMQFQIPIYSGLIGVLQPDKKLIPLNLLPLDIEITFNPHALYSSSNTKGSRQYTVTQFHLYSHMLFFEQEIHRSLEAAVAEHGIFIYCNQFHLAPVSLIAGTVVPNFAYISMNLKSINSIHTLFYYNAFETLPAARKLHFVSHNISSMQVLNGVNLIPQEPVVGLSGTSNGYQHTPFIIELYKAWNKLHDPKTDGAIEAYNFCGDQYAKQYDATPINLDTHQQAIQTMQLLVNKQSHVGRCQFGLSLEGEDLGVDKTMITGRKSQYPFLIYLKSDGGKTSTRTSYMNTFLRADFIVYIRPDLQVVTLGK